MYVHAVYESLLACVHVRVRVCAHACVRFFNKIIFCELKKKKKMFLLFFARACVCVWMLVRAYMCVKVVCGRVCVRE